MEIQEEGQLLQMQQIYPQLHSTPDYIEKDAEYRVIVVNGNVVDSKQKLKRRDFTGERLPYIWNCDNGYIMARDVSIPEPIQTLGIQAVEAIGLRTGAVDIIVKDGISYVLK